MPEIGRLTWQPMRSEKKSVEAAVANGAAAAGASEVGIELRERAGANWRVVGRLTRAAARSPARSNQSRSQQPARRGWTPAPGPNRVKTTRTRGRRQSTS